MAPPVRVRLLVGMLLLTAAWVFSGTWPELERTRQQLRAARAPTQGLAGSAGDIVRTLGLEYRPGLLPMRPDEYPSTRIATPDLLAPDRWTVSIVVDPEDLYSEERGILADRMARGRAAERIAFVSFFEGERLRAATRVGLRVHGQISRIDGRPPSYRLVFRPEYGAPRAPAELPFEHETDRMVVRFEPGLPFMNSIGLDLAGRIGAVAPDHFPVRLLLNGQVQNRMHLAVEQVSAEGWGASRLAGTEHLFFQYRASNPSEVNEAYDTFVRWLADLPAPIDLAHLETRVDVDLFTRHLLTLIYCGTSDWSQGGLVEERGRPAYWVLWDLDLSFTSHAANPWEARALDVILDPARSWVATDPRRVLFLRLLEESDAYRRRFVDIVTEVLNHRLTEGALREILARYETLGRDAGAFGDFDMEAFLLNRHVKVLEDVRVALGLVEPVTVRVDATTRFPVVVDGFSYSEAYVGRYFPGQRIVVEPGEARDRTVRWNVGDRTVLATRLEEIVTGPTEIRRGR